MKKIIPYKSKAVYSEDFKFLDTEHCRRYAGRRIFRIINRSNIRRILDAAHFPENFEQQSKL